MPGGCDHNRLQTEQLQAGWAKVYVYRGRPFALVDSSGGSLMGYRFVVGVAGVPALLVDDHHARPRHSLAGKARRRAPQRTRGALVGH
jgi:hypothetical protein